MRDQLPGIARLREAYFRAKIFGINQMYDCGRLLYQRTDKGWRMSDYQVASVKGDQVVPRHRPGIGPAIGDQLVQRYGPEIWRGH